MRNRHPGFVLGLIMSAASAWHEPKLQTLRRKAGVRHKSHCLCNEFRQTESFLSTLGMVETLPRSKFLSNNQRPTFQDVLISYDPSEDGGQACQAQGQRTFLTASQELIFHIYIPSTPQSPLGACDAVHTKNPEHRKPQSSTTGSAQTWPSLASEEVDYLGQQTNLPFCSGGDMICLPRVFATNPDQMPSVPLLRRHAETQETLEDCPNRSF